MYCKRIGADTVKRATQLGDHRRVQLRQTDIADQQHIGGVVTHMKSAHRLVAEHHPLRPQHHADTQRLGRRSKIPVDGARQLRPTGHGSDQHRSPQRDTEKVGAQVDTGQAGLGQRVIGQPVALEPGGDALILDGLGQADVDMAPLAHRDPVFEARHLPETATSGADRRHA